MRLETLWQNFLRSPLGFEPSPMEDLDLGFLNERSYQLSDADPKPRKDTHNRTSPFWMKQTLTLLVTVIVICLAGSAFAQTTKKYDGILLDEETCDPVGRAFRIEDRFATQKCMEDRAKRGMAKLDAAVKAAEGAGDDIVRCRKAIHNVRPGMTTNEALAIACQPSHINSTATMAGTKEQWVYRDLFHHGFGDQYIYVEGGIVVAVQSTSR